MHLRNPQHSIPGFTKSIFFFLAQDYLRSHKSHLLICGATYNHIPRVSSFLDKFMLAILFLYVRLILRFSKQTAMLFS